MLTSPLKKVVHHLRRAALLQDGAGLSDGQLLEYFVGRGDVAALEALVLRHKQMVWGVCRRVLGNHHDAEDAFQATFLVLVRKAASIVPRDNVANWLYGVAHQTGLKARATLARRKTRERQVTPMPDVAAVDQTMWRDLAPVLDQELSRLPDKYRAVLVVCDLEGKTRKEAARQLGVPDGTVAGHLARARAMLAKRLARHGLCVSGAAFGTLLAQNTASAAVPTGLTLATLNAVNAMAAGQTAAGLISSNVITLMQGVLTTTMVSKIKITTAIVLLVTLACGGVGVVTHGVLAAWQSKIDKQAASQPGSEVQRDNKDAPLASDDQQAGSPSGPGRAFAQVEHKIVVLAVVWAPDGKSFATSTTDGTITIFDAGTCKELRHFSAGKAVPSFAFSPDGKRLALGKSHVLDAETGKQILPGGGGGFGGNAGPVPVGAVEHVAFTSDGQAVFTIAVGQSAVQLNYSGPTSGGGMSMPMKEGGFGAVAPDSSAAGWSDSRGELRFFETKDMGNIGKRFMGELYRVLQVGNCTSIAFGPQAKLLAVGGDAKSVQLWDMTTNQKIRTLHGLEKPATGLVFSADAKSLAALSDDGTTIRIWDLTRNMLRCRINHNRGTVAAMAIAPDGKTVATVAKDSKVLLLWKANARELTHKGPALEMSSQEMAALWNDLANSDFEKADAAFRKLGAAGDNAVEFLAKNIRAVAVPEVDLKRIEKLLAELDADKFAAREAAVKELSALGELVIVPLQRLLEKSPSAEAKQRAALILKNVGEPALTAERRRVLDAIDLLEQLHTTKAIAVLVETERDALIPQIRAEARQALERSRQEKK